MSQEPRDETEGPVASGDGDQAKPQENVVQLRVMPRAAADSPVVEKLEEALRMARAGDFRCVIVVALSTGQQDTVRVMWSSGASDLEKSAALNVTALKIMGAFR